MFLLLVVAVVLLRTVDGSYTPFKCQMDETMSRPNVPTDSVDYTILLDGLVADSNDFDPKFGVRNSLDPCSYRASSGLAPENASVWSSIDFQAMYEFKFAHLLGENTEGYQCGSFTVGVANSSTGPWSWQVRSEGCNYADAAFINVSMGGVVGRFLNLTVCRCPKVPGSGGGYCLPSCQISYVGVEYMYFAVTPKEFRGLLRRQSRTRQRQNLKAIQSIPPPGPAL